MAAHATPDVDAWRDRAGRRPRHSMPLAREWIAIPCSLCMRSGVGAGPSRRQAQPGASVASGPGPDGARTGESEKACMLSAFVNDWTLRSASR
jgi:hypothetical protein